MAYSVMVTISLVSLLLTLALFPSPSSASDVSTARKLFTEVKPDTPVLKYHKGPLLKGNVTVNLVWYGKFSPSQRAILIDFLLSLGPHPTAHHGRSHPSASTWWQTTGEYTGRPSTLVVGDHQVLDEGYSLGKRITARKLIALAAKGAIGGGNAVSVVLTAEDVAVDGFCMSRCGTHRSTRGRKGRARLVYAWVGNSASQCPGECAWPFHQPIYGPQTPPLVPPNADVGIDGMVINLATVLAGTVTNPFGNGYFQGEAGAPMESVSACTGVFGKGAYPGFPGEVLVDGVTGASYNALGINGRRYLLPAMWDLRTSSCKTLV